MSHHVAAMVTVAHHMMAMVTHHVAAHVTVTHHATMAAMAVHAVHPNLGDGGRRVDCADHAGGGRGRSGRDGAQGGQDGGGEQRLPHGRPHRRVADETSGLMSVGLRERLSFEYRSARSGILRIRLVRD
jgi:hypothetical protein